MFEKRSRTEQTRRTDSEQGEEVQSATPSTQLSCAVSFRYLSIPWTKIYIEQNILPFLSEAKQKHAWITSQSPKSQKYSSFSQVYTAIDEKVHRCTQNIQAREQSYQSGESIQNDQTIIRPHDFIMNYRSMSDKIIMCLMTIGFFIRFSNSIGRFILF